MTNTSAHGLRPPRLAFSVYMEQEVEPGIKSELHFLHVVCFTLGGTLTLLFCAMVRMCESRSL